MAIAVQCSCGHNFTAADGDAGWEVRCPACMAMVKVPAPGREGRLRIEISEVRPSAPAAEPKAESDTYEVDQETGPPKMKANRRIAGKTCPVCQAAIKLGEEIVACAYCKLPYHSSCWLENGGCGTYGCAGARSVPPPRTYADFTISGPELGRGAGGHETPGPTPGPQMPLPSLDAPKPYRGLAFAALVLAVVWLCGAGSLLAVILGNMALARMRRSGVRGRERQIAAIGVLLGYVGLLVAATFLVAWLVPSCRALVY